MVSPFYSRLVSKLQILYVLIDFKTNLAHSCPQVSFPSDFKLTIHIRTFPLYFTFIGPTNWGLHVDYYSILGCLDQIFLPNNNSGALCPLIILPPEKVN